MGEGPGSLPSSPRPPAGLLREQPQAVSQLAPASGPGAQHAGGWSRSGTETSENNPSGGRTEQGAGTTHLKGSLALAQSSQQSPSLPLTTDGCWTTKQKGPGEHAAGGPRSPRQCLAMLRGRTHPSRGLPQPRELQASGLA